MRNQVTVGWVVRVLNDGGERFYGDKGTKSSDARKVQFYSDKRKATRHAQRLKKKKPLWTVVTMEAYRDPPNHSESWTPFQEVEFDGAEGDERMFKNSLFTVIVDNFPAPDAPGGFMVHLSIRHNDRNAAHDWRAFQRLKNELLGPEYEAVELYPAESRLVDGANQFHLWAFSQPGVRFPVGYQERLTATPEDASGLGAVQRAGAGSCIPCPSCKAEVSVMDDPNSDGDRAVCSCGWTSSL